MESSLSPVTFSRRHRLVLDTVEELRTTQYWQAEAITLACDIATCLVRHDHCLARACRDNARRCKEENISKFLLPGAFWKRAFPASEEGLILSVAIISWSHISILSVH